MTPAALDLDQFIQKLHHFAAQDFPVQETHKFLEHARIDPAALEPYLLFDPGFYTRNLVHKSAEFELLAICWQPGQNAPVHGHEGEKCWSRVERGKLRFTTYREVSGPPQLELNKLSTVDAGPGHVDGPADIHRVENLFGENAVSLHLYSKPYEACDIYDLEKGTVERKKLAYFSISGKQCI